MEHWNMNYFGAPKHLRLELFCHLGEVLGVFLRGVDNIFLGCGFGKLIDLLGHFILGSIQLRSQTLVFLKARQGEQEMPFISPQNTDKRPWIVISSGGRLRHVLARVGSDMPFLLQRSCATSQHYYGGVQRWRTLAQRYRFAVGEHFQ